MTKSEIQTVQAIDPNITTWHSGQLTDVSLTDPLLCHGQKRGQDPAEQQTTSQCYWQNFVFPILSLFLCLPVGLVSVFFLCKALSIPQKQNKEKRERFLKNAKKLASFSIGMSVVVLTIIIVLCLVSAFGVKDYFKQSN